MKQKYDSQSIEKKWHRLWQQQGVYEPDLKKAKKPFYNLMMFPYPSAEGLHVGNMYAFTGTDIYGRFKRMQGYDVFEPIGLDGFGIHSENYALKIGAHPMKQAKISEKRFYKQLEMVGNGFSWKEHVETYDPEYYKWTQWLFIQMFRQGLAYRKKQAVNWCPFDKTVLADEQVISGICERCGNKVEKRDLEQWFFRITSYADRLLENIDKLDWSEKVKIAQRNWIGRSDGAEIFFGLKEREGGIKVFTTRPDTLYGATYLVLSPEHPFVVENKEAIFNWDEVSEYMDSAKKKSDEDRIAADREKTGVELMGIKAINPANHQEMTVWVADYVLSGYGTGAIMAVPAHDERDFDFAKKFNLPVRPVIEPIDVKGVSDDPIEAQREMDEQILKIKRGEMVYIGSGKLINSGDFDGLDSETGKKEITRLAGGRLTSQYHLRDWLISRQRYWGPPIPMIFCETCEKAGRGERGDMPGWYTETDKHLPVKLPFIKDFRPKGEGTSPLASVKAFYEVKCPACKAKARRETDVSDTFLDSAWYYLRYPSATYKKGPWDPSITKKWLPIDMYIGGAEHSVLHLLYVRFMAMVLKDMKLIGFEEPATRFRAHGLLIKEGAKMSKSKGNVVNPDEYVKRFGADTLRMYLMFLAPFEQGGDFRDQAVLGISRFLDRIWKKSFTIFKERTVKRNAEIERALHAAIKKVSEDVENLHYNTAISSLMVLLNEIESKSVSIDQLKDVLKILAPFAPHITEEIWHELGEQDSIHKAKWPKFNPKYLKTDEVNIVIQINGKVRDNISVSSDSTEEDVKKVAVAREKIMAFVAGAQIKRFIYVPGRLLNIVV